MKINDYEKWEMLLLPTSSHISKHLCQHFLSRDQLPSSTELWLILEKNKQISTIQEIS